MCRFTAPPRPSGGQNRSSRSGVPYLPMTKRVGMISLGCPKNLVDAEIMLGQLRAESDIAITNDLDEADVVIVNTCGFIDAAKQESIDTILEIAERKGKGVERLIVTGCMGQKSPPDRQQSFPGMNPSAGPNISKRSRAQSAVTLTRPP